MKFIEPRTSHPISNRFIHPLLVSDVSEARGPHWRLLLSYHFSLYSTGRQSLYEISSVTFFLAPNDQSGLNAIKTSSDGPPAPRGACCTNLDVRYSILSPRVSS